MINTNICYFTCVTALHYDLKVSKQNPQISRVNYNFSSRKVQQRFIILYKESLGQLQVFVYHLIGIGEFCKKYNKKPSIENNAAWKVFPNSLKGLLRGNPVTEYLLGVAFEGSHRIPLKVSFYTSELSVKIESRKYNFSLWFDLASVTFFHNILYIQIDEECFIKNCLFRVI